MDIKTLTPDFSVADQITPTDIEDIKARGFKSVMSNRPDGESADQPTFTELEKRAAELGLAVHYIPVQSGMVTDEDAAQFKSALETLPKPVLAFCRSGMRSVTLWSLSQAGKLTTDEILSITARAGYDTSSLGRRIDAGLGAALGKEVASHEVVIVGGGAAGTAVAASLLKRNPKLDIAIIDPADTHYYQPGWTLVGGGIFHPKQTAREMAAVLPRKTTWIKAAVAGFEPDDNKVVLEGCRAIKYQYLIVCPGIKLDWNAIPGLADTLGKNGVTSNYRYDLAPYTWELVKNLKTGKALFTQPPMPIKCAGAPQKALYLSADHWHRSNRLSQIDISFYNAGPVLFGVADYVPALMEYIKRYNAALKFNHNLIAIDGANKRATFKSTGEDGATEIVETDFDMIHVCPPQTAPDFVRASPLADKSGWLDVDSHTLRHNQYPNVYGLGDAAGTANAKTAAAARKQAPVVAHNVLCDLGGDGNTAAYDGYGSCPLTVERGKIVLAEFTYGGKLAPSFPKFVIDGTRPTRTAWFLKERLLPPVYWQAMLKGREWMAKPKILR